MSYRKQHLAEHADTRANVRQSDRAFVKVVDPGEQEGECGEEEVDDGVHERVVQAEQPADGRREQQLAWSYDGTSQHLFCR
jgi:hypothetical protein